MQSSRYPCRHPPLSTTPQAAIKAAEKEDAARAKEETKKKEEMAKAKAQLKAKEAEADKKAQARYPCTTCAVRGAPPPWHASRG